MRKKYVRLKSREVIQSLFDRNSLQNNRISSGSVSILYRQESSSFFTSLHSLHVGFAVSKSIKRAVDRNRAKRIMREAFRSEVDLLTNNLALKDSLVMMLVLRSGSVDHISSDLNSCISKLVAKLKVNNEGSDNN